MKLIKTFLYNILLYLFETRYEAAAQKYNFNERMMAKEYDVKSLIQNICSVISENR